MLFAWNVKMQGTLALQAVVIKNTPKYAAPTLLTKPIKPSPTRPMQPFMMTKGPRICHLSP